MNIELSITELIGTTVGLSVLMITLLVFIFQTVIKEFFANAIKHDYDVKLEEFKSQLSQNGNDVKDLRENALKGMHFRQSKLYEKQIEAVEILWSDVIELSKVKHISTNMLAFSTSYERIAKISETDPKIRDLFETLEGDFDITKVNFLNGERLRPFITPLAWAYYNAYKAILVNDIIKFSVLKIGVGTDILKDSSHLKSILEVALPDKKEYINDRKTKSFYYLLEILENRLLEELKSVLKGNENSQESITLASSIMQEVENIQQEQNKKESETA